MQIVYSILPVKTNVDYTVDLNILGIGRELALIFTPIYFFYFEGKIDDGWLERYTDDYQENFKEREDELSVSCKTFLPFMNRVVLSW